MEIVRTLFGNEFEVSLFIEREYPRYLFIYIENSTFDKVASSFGNPNEIKQLFYHDNIYENYTLHSITNEGNNQFTVHLQK